MFTAGSLNRADDASACVNVGHFQPSQEVHWRTPLKAYSEFAPA